MSKFKVNKRCLHIQFLTPVSVKAFHQISQIRIKLLNQESKINVIVILIVKRVFSRTLYYIYMSKILTKRSHVRPMLRYISPIPFRKRQDVTSLVLCSCCWLFHDFPCPMDVMFDYDCAPTYSNGSNLSCYSKFHFYHFHGQNFRPSDYAC